jgi:NADPH-dependent curcumin reductase CurA
MEEEMSSRVNRQWLLASRPQGMVKESDFEYRESSLGEPADGEVLVRVLYLSFDPAMRGWIEDRPSYLPPVQIGEVMRAGAVGQVVASRRPEFSEGDLVQGMLGWQEYALIGSAGAATLTVLPPGTPPTWPLGVLGITGLTAYFGMLDLGRPAEGETAVVSGAAGATGSVAGQIAKLRGCRVIGIAGGPEKCGWLTAEANFDEAIDYKSEPVERRLGELCPGGIDVFFDNVGGSILEAALTHVGQGARFVLCGGISGYNEKEPRPGPRNLMNLVIRSARMEGFIVLNYASRFGEGVKDLARWVAEGRIHFQEDIQQGFENVPRTLLRLFHGQNVGKQLLEVAKPQS